MQDTAKLKNGVAQILAYVIQNTESDIDNKIFDEIAETVTQIVKNGKVTESAVFDGVHGVLDYVTDLTPTSVDDSIVDTVFAAAKLTGVQTKVNNWLRQKFGK